MIGIYQDSFKDYLEDRLGSPVKVTTKNIIGRCPFCADQHKGKDHKHLYISLEAPIFNCFQAGCPAKGSLKKLITKLHGSDVTDRFVDKELLKEIAQRQSVFKQDVVQEIKIPPLNPNMFQNKMLYIKQRLKFANVDIRSIKGLIFDVDQFLEINEVVITPGLFRIRDYLHSNFVGFLTENQTTVMFRNIDMTASFKFYKLKIQESRFLDYYKLLGGSRQSNKVVISEGVFDIFTTRIFDRLNNDKDVRLYASALSSKYDSLIRSIVYHEQEYRLDVIILSDRGIDLNHYKYLKKRDAHVINQLTVYYNKNGKDFNNTPVEPVKFLI